MTSFYSCVAVVHDAEGRFDSMMVQGVKSGDSPCGALNDWRDYIAEIVGKHGDEEVEVLEGGAVCHNDESSYLTDRMGSMFVSDSDLIDKLEENCGASRCASCGRKYEDDGITVVARAEVRYYAEVSSDGKSATFRAGSPDEIDSVDVESCECGFCGAEVTNVEVGNRW